MSDYFGLREPNQFSAISPGKDDKQSKIQLERVSMADLLESTVDEILDLYNDYHTLYNLFKDTIYEARAKVLLGILQSKLKVEGGEIA
ncbi:hypothetical protein D3C76_1737900 [compost metagenome]